MNQNQINDARKAIHNAAASILELVHEQDNAELVNIEDLIRGDANKILKACDNLADNAEY